MLTLWGYLKICQKYAMTLRVFLLAAIDAVHHADQLDAEFPAPLFYRLCRLDDCGMDPLRNTDGAMPSMRLNTTAMRSGSLKPQSSEIIEMGWLVSDSSCFARVILSWQSISQGVQ